MEVENLTQEEMIKLMIDWAKAHRGISWYSGEEDAMRDLCRSALYAIGRDDTGGCVLCQS